ncbi:hypothetical protein ACQPZJ_35450 [Actinoplanes sp. CA-054009]
MQVVGDSKDAQKDLENLADAADDLGKAAKKSSKDVDVLTKSTEKLGDEVDETKSKSERMFNFKGAAGELAEVQSKIKSLNQEFDKTGDTEIFKELRKAKSYERQLKPIADALHETGQAATAAEGPLHKTLTNLTNFKGSRVAAEIKAVEAHLKNLGKEYQQTGNGHVLDSIFDAKKLLGNLKTIASAAADAGEEAGGRFAKMFGMATDLAGPEVKIALIAVGIVAAAAAAPIIGTVLASGIAAGLGVGVIGAGIALAAKDPKIAASAQEAGAMIKGVLTESAQSFVPAVSLAISKVTSLFARIKPALTRIFDMGSGLLGPLTDGIIAFVENALPGLENAVSHLGPVFEGLRNGASMLGTAVGTFFALISQNSAALKLALEQVFLLISGGIVILGALINALTGTYSALMKVYYATTLQFGKLADFIAEENKAKASQQQMAAAAQGATSALNLQSTAQDRLKTAAQEAKTAIQQLNDLLYASANAEIASRQAARSYQEAVDAATQSVKDNGKNLSENTAKGRANNTALDQLASTANSWSRNLAESGASQSQVNKVVGQARIEFAKQATAMGLSEGAAKTLAAKMIAIPNVDRNVDVETASAAAEIAALKEQIASIKGKTVTIWMNTVSSSRKADAMDAQGKAAGGAVRGPGTATSDSIAAWLSNGEYVIKASSAKKLGPKALDYMNSNGALPAFRKGGSVKKKAAPKGPPTFKNGVNSKYAPFVNMVKNPAVLKQLAYGSLDTIKAYQKSIVNNTSGALEKALNKQLNALQVYAVRREAVAKKLEAAKQKLADAIAKRDDYRKQVKDAAIATANITTGNDEVTNAALVLDRLKKQLAKTKQFRAYLAQLQKMGINSTSYQQIVDAGVDGGFATAQALVNGGKGSISQLNSLQSQMNAAADGLGADSSKRLYQAGVDAAAGLVKGLNSQLAAINKASTNLANTIINKLKAVLKIKSPSRVADYEIGQMVGAGAVRGINRSAPAVGDAWRKAVSVDGLATAGLSGASARAASAAGVTVYVTVEGNVTTEKKLAEAIAPTVRDAIVRKGKNNGGRTGLNK